MMQWVKKRNSGKISRKLGRVQKRSLETPRAKVIFSRRAALTALRSSTVEVDLPLMIHLL
jgi:hypothetical protein